MLINLETYNARRRKVRALLGQNKMILLGGYSLEKRAKKGIHPLLRF